MKATARKARAAQREADQWTFDGVNMRTEYLRLVQLPVFRSVRSRLREMQLAVHRGRRRESTGHHKLHLGRIHVTIGKGPWYTGSAVLLHEICHGAHLLLGLTHTKRQRYRLPSGHSGFTVRHAFHDAAFHDLLRIAAIQAYELDGRRLMSLHRECGGSRRAYAMDVALSRALAEHFGPADDSSLAVGTASRP